MDTDRKTQFLQVERTLDGAAARKRQADAEMRARFAAARAEREAVQVAAEEVYSWEGRATVTVLAVREQPRAAFAGNRLAPYADIQWSDEERPTTIDLASMRNWIRQGMFTKVEAR